MDVDREIQTLCELQEALHFASPTASAVIEEPVQGANGDDHHSGSSDDSSSNSDSSHDSQSRRRDRRGHKQPWIINNVMLPGKRGHHHRCQGRPEGRHGHHMQHGKGARHHGGGCHHHHRGFHGHGHHGPPDGYHPGHGGLPSEFPHHGGFPSSPGGFPGDPSEGPYDPFGPPHHCPFGPFGPPHFPHGGPFGPPFGLPRPHHGPPHGPPHGRPHGPPHGGRGCGRGGHCGRGGRGGRGWPHPHSHPHPPPFPPMDVCEEKTRYVLLADLAGWSKSAVTVEVVGEDLVIKGRKDKKKDDPEEPEGTPLLSERHGMMAFARTFPLFDDIKVEEIKGRMAHGLLRVVLPKKAGPKPTDVPLRGTSGSEGDGDGDGDGDDYVDI